VKPIVDSAGNVALPENPIVLTTGPLVGLGDHCIFSTLPKRFAELGYEVYLDRDVAARNPEIIDLLWTNNPHIIDMTDKKPNAGYVRQGLFYEIANRYPSGSIEAMERAHGLPPPYSLAPWVSYTPKPYHIDLSDAVLLDFSSVSSHLEQQGIGEFLRAMKGRYRNAPFIQLALPRWTHLHPPLIDTATIAIGSIYDYLDAAASAKAWIGSEAGGQSLAAIARGEHHATEYDVTPRVSVLMTVPTFCDHGYTYATSDYSPTRFSSDVESDYHWPHEMAQHAYALRCAMSLEALGARR
jgi:hypothetical protein